MWVYPLFALTGGSFGYWLQGVESRQVKLLKQRKEILMEKRRRRQQREADGDTGETTGVLAAAS